MICLLVLTSCSAEQKKEENAQENGLQIALAQLSEEVSMFDYTSEGVEIQVLARVDASGVPRLAYNTCQVCAGSPYAYFENKNGMLICQNCGNAFSYDSIGQAGYGCMPMGLTEYDVKDDSLFITSQTLSAMQPLFVNWKKGL